MSINSETADTAARLIKLITKPVGKLRAWTFNDKNAGVKALLAAAPEVQIAVVLQTVQWFGEFAARGRKARQMNPMYYCNLWHEPGYPDVGVRMSNRLLRRRLPFSDEELSWMLKQLALFPAISLHSIPIAENIIGIVEKRIAAGKSMEPFRDSLQSIRKALSGNAPERKLGHRVQRILDQNGGPELRSIVLEPGEAWSDAALADLQGMQPGRRQAWIDLLKHCQAAGGASPSTNWQKKASALLKAVGQNEAKQHILKWFPLVNQPRTRRLTDYLPGYQPDPNQMIIEPHANILKGLAWCAGFTEDKELARALGALALSAYRKIPLKGPREVKIGNACVTALGSMPGMEGAYQLAWLKAKVKFSAARVLIEKAFDATAERLHVARDDFEELAVPTFGLTGLADPKSADKEMQRMLAAQRPRLESLFLQKRTWPFPLWRERYLDHPLVGVLARRLLWNFTSGKRTCTGIWFDGRLVDAQSKPIQPAADTTVSLWHPIGRSAEDILAWRSWIETQGVTQPFKQAHREVYVLTDAERDTGDYSNRFAAHILKQHQFNALCAQRGWRNKLRLFVDDDFPPASLDLPEWNLQAEFSVEGASEDFDDDVNPNAVFRYVATDDVQFRRLRRGLGIVPLERVPPLVFSEVMRDVDLFVGVASVGNDPTWSDGASEERYRDYWQGYSFGELNATAKIRKDLLQRLVPKLKIAAQCQFEEKFLVVKGSLRTYKIHLGSGNILMAPNDQYLCILPKQREGKSVLLPFEGDQKLSEIISKAFLLANDAKISNRRILSQIRRK